jgi:mannose-6-phosphate isomerase-like protein (cupin superfamily)
VSALGRGFRATLQEGLARLPSPDGARFADVFRHGTLQVGVYAPRGTDPQQPHERDEVYVVGTGTGTFYCDGNRAPFSPGDFLFVPAGIEHRFEAFTDDLAVWVLFYGPTGGEAGTDSR